MSVLVSHASHPFGLIATLQRLFERSWFGAEARGYRARYHRAVTELQQLSDRDLADIGISRWDIASVAREHAARG